MKHSPNPNKSFGFTFIEIMLTIFMVGFLLTAVLGLQETVFSGVITYASSFERIFLLKDQLFKAAFARAKDRTLEEQKKETTKIENPITTITYEQKKPQKESALQKFDNMMIEQVNASWQTFRGEQQETMISYVFMPPRKKQQ